MTMQDSQITYLFKEEGIDALRAKAEGLGVTLNSITKQANGTFTGSGKLASATDDVAEATGRASKAQGSYFGHIARTTVQSALVNKLFLEFVDVSGQAIQQVDLMQNFPATMTSMGQSAEDATDAMQALRDYVGQVGGNLGDATSYVTRFTGATSNVKSAVAIFTGLNNALIAGDSSLEEQRQSLIQFAQALERGRPDLKEWRNMTQNMSYQLALVAKEMGYVNANALGEALTSGEESMATFTTVLTELATGTGPIAQQAMARMNGMQFAFNMLKNTMTQGLAAIVNSLGRSNIVSFFSILTQVVKVLTGWVLNLISAFVWLLNLIGSLFGLPTIKLQSDIKGVAEGVGTGAENAEDLAGGLGDAGKEAKKLRKSLAAFDKMNVLPDPADSSGKKGGGGGAGGAGFDPGEVGKLGDMFGKIGSGVQEISKWAKVFAAIIAGIVALNFGKAIIGRLIGITNGFLRGAKAAAGFKDSLKGIGDLPNMKQKGSKAGSSFVSSFVAPVSGLPSLLGVILGAIPGIFGFNLGKLVGVFARVFSFGSGGIGLIVVGAIAAIASTVLFLKENWDTVTKAMSKAWKIFVKTIRSVWDPVISEFKRQWSKLSEITKPVIDEIAKGWSKLKFIVSPVIKGIVSALSPLIKSVKELYQEHIEPLVNQFTKWAQESGVLMATLKILGVIIATAVLLPIATIAVAIGLVVIGFAALTAAIVLVIAKLIEFGIYIFGGGLWEDIKSVVSSTAQWFSDKFNEALDFVKGIFSTIGQWFQERWDEIVDVFQSVGQWFSDKFREAWDGIIGVFKGIGQWFQERWDDITNVFKFIGSWFGDRFKEGWDNITNKFKSIGSWFRDRKDDITSAFSNISIWFKNKFQDAWRSVTDIFSNVKTWFKINVVDKVVSAFSGIKNRIKNFFTGVWDGVGNGLKEALNRILRLPLRVPSIEVAGQTVGGQTLIPRLARGGVVDQATLAVIGEDGKEAVVPLENNLEWLDKLAAKINTNGTGGSGEPIQVIVQVGEEQIVNKVIDLINEKTNMSGRNAIYV